jgi:Malonate decarboxylase, alpha subunit, transporter
LLTDWEKQRTERRARLKACSRYANGKLVESEKTKVFLEAVIRPGDRICLEGDNQKQADFLAAVPASVDPSRIHDLHIVQSGIVLQAHLDLFERGIARKLDFSYSGPQGAALAHALVVRTENPLYVEPLFTRDPASITENQILMAMVAINGIYAEYGVKRLNHGIGFPTAAIELLLPTYGEQLGLKGKIATHWTLNPHPAWDRWSSTSSIAPATGRFICDQVLSFENLIKDVWHFKFLPEASRVNVHMGPLRAKVDGPNEAPMTRNVRGQGFILSAAPALPKCLRGLQGVEQRELAQTNSNNV